MSSLLLTTTATTVARDEGLVKRTRAMDGGKSARTFILGWLEQSYASRSQLVQVARDYGVSIRV